MEPEHNPSALRPEYEVYADSIEEYLRALRERDYTDIRGASDNIRRYPSFFPKDPDRLHELTVELSRAYLKDRTPEVVKKIQEDREQALAIVLRSYTYTATTVDAGLIYEAIAYVGVGKKWLRNSLRPTHQLRLERGVRTDDSKFVRYKGHQIMRQLDLVPFYGNTFMRIIDSAL